MGSDRRSFDCTQDDKGFGFERTAKAKALWAGGRTGWRSGFLHCAAHGEAVRGSVEMTVYVGRVETAAKAKQVLLLRRRMTTERQRQKAKARATADPFGMTTRKRSQQQSRSSACGEG
jgi:hypothetical protein